LNEWWNGLSFDLKIYWFLAIPFTVLFLIQTLLTLIGVIDFDSSDLDFDGCDDMDLGDSHLDVDNLDLDDNSHLSGSASFRVLTIRNIIVFFTVFSWSGIVFTNNDFNPITTIILSTIIGSVLVLIISGLYYFFSRMTEEGNMDLSTAINTEAKVYLTIPANGQDKGKVMAKVQGVLRELYAVTDGDAIPTGEKVTVVEVVDNQYLLVRKISSIQEV
jgi:hypothetical protein